MYSVKQCEEIINRAHQLFRIDRNNIFFMINYQGEEVQDFYKELLALRILKKSIERAKQFIIQRKKILIKEINGKGKKIISLARDDISLSEFREIYGTHINKMLKNEEYDFVEYGEDEEDDVYLNEIDQIDEEHGEKIKFLNIIAKGKGKKNYYGDKMGESLSNSLNSRVYDSALVSNSPKWEHRNITCIQSQDGSKSVSKDFCPDFNKQFNETDYGITKAFEIDLEDSKDEDISYEISTREKEQEVYQDKYDELVVEDYSPQQNSKVNRDFLLGFINLG